MNVAPVLIITLKTFLLALARLESPLPPEIQKQINQIGNEIALNVSNIGKLDSLSHSHQSLRSFYELIRARIEEIEEMRSKAGSPTGATPSESYMPDISNISVKIDEDRLLSIAKQILTAPESASMAKSSSEIAEIAESLGITDEPN